MNLGERTDPRLESWIAEYIERRESGEALSHADFLREHVEGGEALRAALHDLEAAESLLPSSSVSAPTRIGPYRIEGELGSGGMGRVFRCVHDDDEAAPLALKLLHLPLADRTRSLERFRREGQALARIAHPGVVRIHETGLFDGRPYIAMERVEGTSLAAHIAAARERMHGAGLAPRDALDLPGEGPSLERAVRVVARTARAIACVHASGVLHRDLNPRNVLVRANGEPVVIDFGLMRTGDDPTLTGTGDVLGTPQYLAPEQARGERADERTDVFGLGCVLRELLSLAPPRLETGTFGLLRRAATRPLVRLRRLSPDVPRELAWIADSATAFALRWRTRSAQELADDLEAWLARRPIRARAPGVLERAHGAWLGHRLAITAGAVVVLAGAVAWLALAREPAIDPRVLSAQRLNALVVAWLEGDTARARRHFDEFHAGDPKYPLGEFLDALTAGDLERDAQHPASRALLAGERARRAGRADEAVSYFATAGDIFPGQSLVELLRGLASLEAHDPASARVSLENASFHFGQSRRFHLVLAETYRALGAHSDAERATRAAEALTPRPASAAGHE
ncbi:MAG: protein kinase domain-containing protein [Planctomycetota bacterium]